jgi:hypothetical protein
MTAAVDSPGARSVVQAPVAVAAVITLLLTAVRLSGELLGWDPRFFGTDAGGGGALLGIGWLIPVFGAWFATVLRARGQVPANPRRALALALLGLVPVAIGFTIVKTMMGVTPAAMGVGGAGCVVGALIAGRGWPALRRTLFGYALLARAPILAITFLDVFLGWGTHYGKLAPGAEELAPLPRALVLCLAQMIFWVPITLLGGLLAGAIAVRWRRPACD